MATSDAPQRISRLTPLSAVLALIDTRVGAVAPQKSAVEAALGLTLAEDVVAAKRPSRPIALRDGFAVEAATVADAGPYVPVALSVDGAPDRRRRAAAGRSRRGAAA